MISSNCFRDLGDLVQRVERRGRLAVEAALARIVAERFQFLPGEPRDLFHGALDVHARDRLDLLPR